MPRTALVESFHSEWKVTVVENNTAVLIVIYQQENVAQLAAQYFMQEDYKYD